MSATDERLRVVFLVRVPTERREAFLDAYERIRHSVANVPGHVRDQVCESIDDPEQWLITSEWESLEAFEAWERDDAHRQLVAPMRACITEARSLRFHVKAQTTRRSAEPSESQSSQEPAYAQASA